MGQKYAKYTPDGTIVGYYDSVDSPPPADATVVEITDDEWRMCLESPGFVVIDGAVKPPPPPSAEQALVSTKSAQVDLLQTAYQTAIDEPISFTTAAGVTSSYPSGNTIALNGQTATQNISGVIAAGPSTWTTGWWLDANNVAHSFTFSDLQALAQDMQTKTSMSWAKLVAKIAAVQAATTISEVQSVTF